MCSPRGETPAADCVLISSSNIHSVGVRVKKKKKLFLISIFTRRSRQRGGHYVMSTQTYEVKMAGLWKCCLCKLPRPRGVLSQVSGAADVRLSPGTTLRAAILKRTSCCFSSLFPRCGYTGKRMEHNSFILLKMQQSLQPESIPRIFLSHLLWQDFYLQQ